MSERAPYSRVYWSVMDDPKFATVYDDDAALATWLRLLISADAMWPSPAPLPRGVKSRPLGVLVTAGLVDLATGDRYRIHGLDSERTRRSDAGRNAAAVRWQSERIADPMLDETRRDELRRDETSNAGVDPVVTYSDLFGTSRPSPKVMAWIDSMTEKYGASAVDVALRREFVSDPDRLTILGRAQGQLVMEARAAERRELEDEKTRNKGKRAPIHFAPLPEVEPTPEEEARLIAEYEAAISGKGAA